MSEDLATRTFLEIERRLDVTRLTYKGVSYWPLARLLIWPQILYRARPQYQQGVAEVPVKVSPPRGATGPVDFDRYATPEGATLFLSHRDFGPGAVERPDLLLFTRAEEHLELLGDAGFAKYLDTLADLAPEGTRIAKIELYARHNAIVKRHRPPLYLVADDIMSRRPASEPEEPALVAELGEVLRDLGFELDADDLVRNLDLLLGYQDVFAAALAALEPKMVALSCYYHVPGMALMRACRAAGIPTVDLQHGRLGPIHPMYTDWSTVPPGGYDLMPGTVWCWGDRTRGFILRDRPDGDTARPPRPLVGGNTWLSRWVHGSGLPVAAEEEAAFDELVRGRERVILVSLQPVPHPITHELADAILMSPPDWLWLMRPHPLRAEHGPMLQAVLAERGAVNVEFSLAASLPLFWLLRRVHHHVTRSSSSSLEALYFGVPTALVDPIGRQAFPKEVEAGAFRETLTADALLADIASGRRLPAGHQDDFLTLDPAVATATLRRLLDEAG